MKRRADRRRMTTGHHVTSLETRLETATNLKHNRHLEPKRRHLQPMINRPIRRVLRPAKDVLGVQTATKMRLAIPRPQTPRTRILHNRKWPQHHPNSHRRMSPTATKGTTRNLPPEIRDGVGVEAIAGMMPHQHRQTIVMRIRNPIP